MFPEVKSREALRLERKQNELFPQGTDIKCFVIHSKDEQIKQTNKQTSLNTSRLSMTLLQF